MATCPRCHGHLTSGHECPRSRQSKILELVITALAGGIAAIAFIAIFDPGQVTVDLDGLVFSGGALLALAVHQVFMWSRRS